MGKFLKDVRAGGLMTDPWQWVQRGDIWQRSAEAFVFAAQEQALHTRFLRAKIEGEDISPLCRICGKTVESVGHLASGM